MILKENYADSVPCRTLNVQLFQPVFFPESVRHVSGMGVRFHRNMHRAKLNQWRVPEKSLITLIILGGGIGALVGIAVFHHKTRKSYLTIIAVVCIMIHLFLFFIILR